MTTLRTEEYNGAEIQVLEAEDGGFEIVSIDYLQVDVFDGQTFGSMEEAVDEAAAFVDSSCCNVAALFDLAEEHEVGNVGHMQFCVFDGEALVGVDQSPGDGAAFVDAFCRSEIGGSVLIH